MASRRKTIQKSARRAILPEAVSVFLKKNLIRAWGLTLGALFFAALGAFISYERNDPSWNNASNAEATNWLGMGGAYVADTFIQTLGVGAFILVLPLLSWGWRIFTFKGLPLIWRHLLLMPVAVLFCSLTAAIIPRAEGWPLEIGMGGMIGERLLGYLKTLVAYTGVDFYPLIMGVLSLGGTVASLLFVLALEKSHWQAIGQGIRWCLSEFFHRLWQGSVKVWGGLKTAFLFIKAKLSKEASPAETIDVSKKKVTPKLPAKKPLVEAPIVGETPKKVKPGKREEKERQPMLALMSDGEFVLPPLSLLSKPQPLDAQARLTKSALEQNARMLESVLDDFGVQGDITKVRPGPVVTLYELEPAPGTKTSRVINLADDIARSMSAISARVAVVPGKNAIGIELPNSKREIVALREILSSNKFEDSRARLPMALGKDIGGGAVIADLAAMPHLLVAGTTGSGKSVAINVMILSLLYRFSPAQCRLIMVDPKMLELSVYDDIPHLLTPVVTDPKRAVVALKWAVREMEQRYQNMSKLQVRNIAAYNERLAQARKKGESIVRKVQTGFDSETGSPVYEEEELDLTPLPMIVVVVDEMADLMLVAGKDIEALIQRLAQMARAAGIHLIMATQRPSVDVITGTIKANFPTRIGFQVTSKIDSRTILGEQGAEQLLGMGDMLYMAGGGRITRVHGPFVSDDEVERVVTALKKQGKPDYLQDITEEPEDGFDSNFLQNSQMTPNKGKSSGDDLYDQAVAIVARDKKASTSYIQRQLQIGYNRAANIIDMMERDGVISAANHVGKREVLVQDQSGEY